MLTTEQELLIRAMRDDGMPVAEIALRIQAKESEVQAMCDWMVEVRSHILSDADRFYFSEVRMAKPKRCPYCGGRTITDPCRVCRQRALIDRARAFEEISRNGVSPHYWPRVYQSLLHPEESCDEPDHCVHDSGLCPNSV